MDDEQVEPTATETSATTQEPNIPTRPLPEELPPVEPPSAGFIIQLFVVPALIVSVLIGGWVLVRKMVSTEQDWQKLVKELGSENGFRSGRSAAGLAQLLRADEKLGDKGKGLAKNSQLAEQLATLLREELKTSSPKEDDVQRTAFLSRTLGMMDVPDVVVPVLREAMQENYHRDVRKNAIASAALILGRYHEKGTQLEVPELLADVRTIAADSDPFLRQLGAYTLGLFPPEDSRELLFSLLSDADQPTRVNAAIGLARQNSTEGYHVLTDVLENAADMSEVKSTASSQDSGIVDSHFEQLVATMNVLKAVGELSDRFDAQQRAELEKSVVAVAENAAEPKIRVEANRVAQLLKKQEK